MSGNQDKKGMIYFINPNRKEKRKQDSSLSFIERSRRELAEKPEISTLTIRYSFEETLQAAEMGIIEAQYSLGLYYYNSPGPASDMKKSIAWFTKAAEQGHLNAMLYLGEIYECGYCDRIDLKKARKWYQKAAEQGDEHGQIHMARYYHNGEAGLKKNPKKAFKWDLMAAEQGNIIAMGGVAYRYADGDGVKQDYEKALEWFLKAGYKGDIFKYTTIGDFYRLGKGVEVDYERAAYWYLKAVKEKAMEFEAFNSLGFIYLTGGNNLKSDYKKAIKWFKKAAKWDEDIAVCFLKYINENGEEAGHDLDRFKEWLYEKAGQGDREAGGALSCTYEYGYITPIDEAKSKGWDEFAYGDLLRKAREEEKNSVIDYKIRKDMPAFEKAYLLRKSKEREEQLINNKL